jgi:phospholipid/cholesterol/gamma-HCH transport system permease protein
MSPTPPSAPATPAPHSVSVNFSQGDNQQAAIELSGWLDATTLPQAWDAAVTPTVQKAPAKLTVDLAKLNYCDGAGLGLFAELRRVVSLYKGEMQLVGVRPELERFIGMSMLQDPTAGELTPPEKQGGVVYIGKATWAILKDFHELIAFIGEMTVTLIWAIGHPFHIRFRDMIKVCVKAGADALPVVSLLGFLIGAILAFQSAGPLERFGAQPLIPTMVSIAVIREMGPLITAVILAGRSGSAFAAEIGTMQVTEELSALKTLGLEPVRFLVVPRVLAALIVTPLLTAFNILMSLFGAYVVMAGLGYSLNFYIDSVQKAVHYDDFIGGIAKSFVFALIVAGIGCLRGMQTKSGPGAVGDSTTRAVVAAIVYCIAADAVIGVVYYYVGI